MKKQRQSTAGATTGREVPSLTRTRSRSYQWGTYGIERRRTELGRGAYTVRREIALEQKSDKK